MASSIVGYDVATMCFEAPQKELNKTIYSQICTLTVELALYEVFNECRIRPDALAGFSLGEYVALVASNSINIENAFKLVYARALTMENVIKDNVGEMVAVINLSIEKVIAICKEIDKDKVKIANYNSYKQIVVSLAKDSCDVFIKKVKFLGGYTIRLNVNRPFHHEMMRPAADYFYIELRKYSFLFPDRDLYINVTGEKFNENDSFVKRLYEQMYKPVQWTKIVENMLYNGIHTFYEISPKVTLAPFINNVSGDSATVINIQNELI